MKKIHIKTKIKNGRIMLWHDGYENDVRVDWEGMVDVVSKTWVPEALYCKECGEEITHIDDEVYLGRCAEPGRRPLHSLPRSTAVATLVTDDALRTDVPDVRGGRLMKRLRGADRRHGRSGAQRGDGFVQRGHAFLRQDRDAAGKAEKLAVVILPAGRQDLCVTDRVGSHAIQFSADLILRRVRLDRSLA